MLSILIPVYNFDVRTLVKDLYNQSLALTMPVEIIVYDDASNPEFRMINRDISRLKNVVYEELETNLGRSKIRNVLASKANYQYLIFMDCDSQVEEPDYLSNYLSCCQDVKVVCGGRSYQLQPPEESIFHLHWYYGINRETTSAATRMLSPYKSFMTNNFMISKQIFQIIHFNEELTGYGHEDTLFGIGLKSKQIKIHHIDNPLRHIGLEPHEYYLEKTGQGIDNLVFIAKKFPYLTDLFTDIKLLKYFLTLKKLKLIAFSAIIFRIFKTTMQKNLLGNNPNLKIFDFYKLGLFCMGYCYKK